MTRREWWTQSQWWWIHCWETKRAKLETDHPGDSWEGTLTWWHININTFWNLFLKSQPSNAINAFLYNDNTGFQKEAISALQITVNRIFITYRLKLHYHLVINNAESVSLTIYKHILWNIFFVLLCPKQNLRHANYLYSSF